MPNSYKFPRSYVYRAEFSQTTELRDVHNPFKNEFFSSEATIEDAVYFMSLFLQELTPDKVQEIWPRSTPHWLSFVLHIRDNHPALVPYLFIADVYNEYDNEHCMMKPHVDGQRLYYEYYYCDGTQEMVTRLGAAKTTLTRVASIPLRNANLPVNSILGKLYRYIANDPICFWVNGVNTTPLNVRMNHQESTFNGFVRDEDGYGYWSPVYANGQQADRSRLTRLFSHSQDVTRLLGARTVAKRILRKGDKEITHEREGAPILYGVELECSTNKSTVDIINAQSDVFLVCKSDGSITGSKSNAVELVTRPQDLRTHRRGWAKFMGSFFNKETHTYPDFDVTKNTDNGMHVHISRDSFSDNAHIQKLCYFMAHPLHQDFILAVSERDKSSMQRWTKLPGYELARSDGYIYSRSVTTFMGLGKYSAVNLGKDQTIEIRIFKGIFSYATVMKNLEFCDALVNYTQENGIVQLTLDGFLSWLNSLPNRRYKALRLFLSKVDVDVLLDEYKVQKQFRSASTPEQAMGIIEKKNIPQTKALTSLLNVRFGGKKVFHWDNKKQCLILCHRDKAALYSFDGEFHALYGRVAATNLQNVQD